MRRQPVPQLTRISSQINSDLLQPRQHLARGTGIADELAGKQPLALPRAADDGPHDEVGHVDGHGLGQARKLGCIGPDLGRVAHAVVCREDGEGADYL